MSLTISNNNNGRVSDVMISERKNATVKPQLQKSAAKRNTDCLLLSCKLPSQEEEKNILQLLRSQQQQEKDSVESMAETMSEQMKVRRLCARIAARIKAGDRVPLQDRRYLKRKDPIQYLMATLMRKQNDDPKRWQTLLKGKDLEKEQSPGVEISVGKSETVRTASETAVSDTPSNGGQTV